MSVPISNSVGYEGTVNEAQWASLMANAGGRSYGVLDASSWKVSAGSADRELRIAPGTGFGHGVIDSSSATASLALPAIGSGSRWYCVVVRRDWQANVSVFDVLSGPTGAAAIPTRQTSPGTADEQPIALVRVQAGQSQIVEIRDLRVWGGDGGAYANDALVLQYLNRVGTQVRVGGVLCSRILDQFGNPQWAKTRAPAQGVFVGATSNGGVGSPAGTVTVAHNLGVMPTVVLATDRNAGAIPGTRKVVLVVATDTAIQFAVYNGGSLLVNNPVEFGWVAFA